MCAAVHTYSGSSATYSGVTELPIGRLQLHDFLADRHQVRDILDTATARAVVFGFSPDAVVAAQVDDGRLADRGLGDEPAAVAGPAQDGRDEAVHQSTSVHCHAFARSS